MTIKTASKAELGTYLVDAKGMTLYYFTRDNINKSTAVGPVLVAWPLFYAENIVVPQGLNAADFGTITREDGAKVTTYKGWPLYYYFKDKAAGDTLGEGVDNVWFVIKSPFYNVMLMTKADIGNYFIDSKGMTLYYFTRDSANKSTATGQTLVDWPLFYTEKVVTTSNQTLADFGTITREDGAKVTTYKSWPLYYFINDKNPGDTNGQGLNNVWFVVTSNVSSAPPTPGPAITINLKAQNFAFNMPTITVPAGAAISMNFDNADSGYPHNFALYTDSTATKSIYVGKMITGVSMVNYNFTVPTTPGNYYFRCDAHPTVMTGTFIVTGSGGASPTTNGGSSY